VFLAGDVLELADPRVAVVVRVVDGAGGLELFRFEPDVAELQAAIRQLAVAEIEEGIASSIRASASTPSLPARYGRR
jgi:hypothetical protein